MAEAGHQRTVEIKSTPWQKVVAFCLFVLLEMLFLLGLLSILFPQWLPNQSIGNASGIENALAFAGLLVMCFLAFYIWWATIKYVLIADETGIMQSDGFRTMRLRWEEIGSYQWQVWRGTSDLYRELMLRNQRKQIIFRPFAPVLVSDKSIMKARTDFWKFVAEKIDSTKSE